MLHNICVFSSFSKNKAKYLCSYAALIILRSRSNWNNDNIWTERMIKYLDLYYFVFCNGDFMQQLWLGDFYYVLLMQ